MEPGPILGRLLLAALCSGAIGYERETAQKAAGLRTHTLVGLGAAIFSIASIVGFEGPDESRIAAQIVTGVGFLGAGAIFREGAIVSGLTTAAGLWVVASIGMAAGSGSYWLAALGTIVTLATLYGLLGADIAIARSKAKVRRRLEVHISNVKKLEELLKFIRRIDPEAEQLNFKRTGDQSAMLTITCQAEDLAMMTELLASHRAVDKVEELSPLYWEQPGDD
ncbi:MAG: MgtC/SapB family protein [Acidimicrobiia bacterium]|nr:MgtC/SapB family protein [Acidimicrobiia bacterium]